MIYSCTDPVDDIFAPCFGCDNAAHDGFQTQFDNFGNFYSNGYEDYETSNKRQSGESFQATRQSRRLICRKGASGNSCKLRINRLMQIRNVTYGRANQFLQNEEYLSQEDINIVRK